MYHKLYFILKIIINHEYFILCLHTSSFLILYNLPRISIKCEQKIVVPLCVQYPGDVAGTCMGAGCIQGGASGQGGKGPGCVGYKAGGGY